MPTASTHQDNFDQFAQDYRQIHSQNVKLAGADSDYFSDFKARIVAQQTAGMHPGAILLDLGCGDGTMARFLVQHLPGIALHGLDISAASIAVANALGLAGAQFAAYDGGSIPMADASVDVCTLATVLHHIAHSHHLALLQEVRRVLRPGGKLFIFEHNPYNPLTRHMVNTCPFDADAVLLTAGFAQRTVRAAGFASQQTRYVLFMPRGGVIKHLLWLERYLGWLPLGGQYWLCAVK